MTWAGKRRKQLPGNWGTLRKAVLERDGYRCTALEVLGLRCMNPATEVDHHLGPHDHRLSSLRSLCHTHHAEKTQREAHAALAEARAQRPRRRPTRRHPGLA